MQSRENYILTKNGTSTWIHMEINPNLRHFLMIENDRKETNISNSKESSKYFCHCTNTWNSYSQSCEDYRWENCSSGKEKQMIGTEPFLCLAEISYSIPLKCKLQEDKNCLIDHWLDSSENSAWHKEAWIQ